jgi:hypothetical protein
MVISMALLDFHDPLFAVELHPARTGEIPSFLAISICPAARLELLQAPTGAALPGPHRLKHLDRMGMFGIFMLL